MTFGGLAALVNDGGVAFADLATLLRLPSCELTVVPGTLESQTRKYLNFHVFCKCIGAWVVHAASSG